MDRVSTFDKDSFILSDQAHCPVADIEVANNNSYLVLSNSLRDQLTALSEFLGGG